MGQALQVSFGPLFVVAELRASRGSRLGFVLIRATDCNHTLPKFDPLFLLLVFPPSLITSPSHECDYHCKPVFRFGFLKKPMLAKNFPSWIQSPYNGLFLCASCSNWWRYILYNKWRLRVILKWEVGVQFVVVDLHSLENYNDCSSSLNYLHFSIPGMCCEGRLERGFVGHIIGIGRACG